MGRKLAEDHGGKQDLEAGRGDEVSATLLTAEKVIAKEKPLCTGWKNTKTGDKKNAK